MAQQDWQHRLKDIAVQAKEHPAGAEMALRDLLRREEGNDLCAALAHDMLGRVLFALQRVKEALEALELSVTLMRRAKGDGSPMTCLAMQNLAHIYMALNNHDKSITLGRQALDGLIASCGEGHGLVAGAMLHLSASYYACRDFDEAERLLRGAKEIWEATTPVPPELGTCLNNLGRIEEERGHFAEGIALHRQAVELRTSLLGDHEDTAFSLGNLGVALASNGDWQEAAETLEKAVAMYEKLGLGQSELAEGYRGNLEVCRKKLAETGV
ncbi:MAG: tetratricopeptide repeat protein [Desulfovibrio sp.]|uniref:tetratricopeptide repeat protein n=1 Tax=Desulfovibrio sp. TaxID=885 RepID=UPI0025B82504|nr:tetratricopeptide repeat protein [Desulfovibrio sp.]MCI7567788.1 tetratricopeptide repeat protein [Desulfovibrio sp.]